MYHTQGLQIVIQGVSNYDRIWVYPCIQTLSDRAQVQNSFVVVFIYDTWEPGIEISERQTMLTNGDLGEGGEYNKRQNATDMTSTPSSIRTCSSKISLPDPSTTDTRATRTPPVE